MEKVTGKHFTVVVHVRPGGGGSCCAGVLRCVWSLAGAGVVVRYMGPDYGGGGGGVRGEYGRAGGGGGTGGGRAEVTPWQCEFCHKYYGSNNSLRNHRSVYHRGQVPDGSAKVSQAVAVAGGVGASMSRGVVSSHVQGRPIAAASLGQRAPPQPLPPHIPPRLTAHTYPSISLPSGVSPAISPAATPPPQQIISPGPPT